ncbi:putative transcriptional regulator [Desulfosporosinus acidiphilus SJ4]|uniref:Putative transcriptional regulator n=1 Tax=Desulfosporosinus acidiphilus (strain DSM 22704 / JCM 16185 / SJ4) TaxID=646529 RepID=I4D826_DESAJ|nr:helix-turn-helix transcriptional regulator [Desulfosporosinus acidiphilus]AFM41950.1 putative transcriptional regulator [Desulfosporosinus acidiphilus SJ4]
MLNKRLKELREEKLLTQAELAEKLNISRGSVGNYEKDERMPDGEVLVKFADFFGVSTDYLLGRSDFKNYGQEYDFRRKLAPEFFDDLNRRCKDYESNPLIREINELMVSVDEKYSTIVSDIITGNIRFRKLALDSLDKLLNMVALTGEILKENEYDSDMDEYIKFLNKLKDTSLLTSDFGNIQADQTQIRACNRFFNEFISFYIYSIIDSEPITEITEE